MSYLAKAIWKLRPESEFSFTDEDYSTVKWDILEGKAPTIAEIETAIEQVKNEEIEAEKNAIAKKNIAEQKLVALGLTQEDLKALGLG